MAAEGSKFLTRTCAECISYRWVDDGVSASGTRKKFRSVQACLDAGKIPLPRIPGTRTPCNECPKVRDNAPVASYYYAQEITDRTFQVIQHFEECDAVGQFPEDPIVRQNAATIRRIREQVKRGEHNKGMAHLIAVLTMGQGL